MEYTLSSHESATSHLPGSLIEDVEVMQHAMCTEASAVRYNGKSSPGTGQPVSATDQVLVYGVEFFQSTAVPAASVESIVRCAGPSSEIPVRANAPTAFEAAQDIKNSLDTLFSGVGWYDTYLKP